VKRAVPGLHFTIAQVFALVDQGWQAVFCRDVFFFNKDVP
jgi:hypothetical protein